MPPDDEWIDYLTVVPKPLARYWLRVQRRRGLDFVCGALIVGVLLGGLFGWAIWGYGR